jgi:hypothetical protein
MLRPGVYALLCYGRRRAYVGATMRTVYHRLVEHFKMLETGCHPVRELQADYDRTGGDGIRFLFCDNWEWIAPDELREHERFWMAHFERIGCKLYNRTRRK